ASNPSVVYASGYQGAKKSTDGGVTWTTLSTPATSSVAVDPTNASIVYVGTYASSQVMKSVDGGATWTMNAITGAPAFHNVVSLAVDPTQPRAVWAGLDSGDVFKSVDGGVTWSISNAG